MFREDPHFEDEPMPRTRRPLLLTALAASSLALVGATQLAPAARAAAPPRADKKADEAGAGEKAEAERKQATQDKAIADFAAQLKTAQVEAGKNTSHTLFKEVKLAGKDGNALQTLAVDGTGRVLALVAPPRDFSQTRAGATSEVHVLDPDGKPVGVWPVGFHASAVNAGPDGTVYVAGDGKLARFDKDGKPLGAAVELPFVAAMLRDKDKIKAAAEKQVKAQKESFEKMVAQFKDRVAKLDEKEAAAKEAGEELTKSEATQLKQNRQILDDFKETEKYYATMTVESVVAGILGRVKVVSSVSVNDKDVYVVCGENEGFGFGLWRMGLDLKDAKKVTGNISGCCGQMDVQCCGDDILVAENTKHRFARYDRDGKELAAGGRRGTGTDPGGFGGCCNPMNVTACGGDVLTAESEGIVKRFGPGGEFKGVVGAVAVTGGCKNVAVGANADGSRVYFCDQPGGRVLILALKAKADPKPAPK